MLSKALPKWSKTSPFLLYNLWASGRLRPMDPLERPLTPLRNSLCLYRRMDGWSRYLICERQRALYGIKCVLRIFWQTWLHISKALPKWSKTSPFLLYNLWVSGRFRPMDPLERPLTPLRNSLCLYIRLHYSGYIPAYTWPGSSIRYRTIEIRYSTIETKEAARIGYNVFLKNYLLTYFGS
jgi:hypothetical protein